MKIHLAGGETFQQAKPYGLEHMKIELINQNNKMVTIFH